MSVAFTPDGHTLATGSLDRSVMLWDLSDRAFPRRLGPPLTGHVVLSVAFTPDGHTLATGGADNTVNLRSIDTIVALRTRAVELACAYARRGLNPTEWARHVPGLPYHDGCTT